MSPAPLLKPTEYAEARLIEAILGGEFPIDAHLPAERELAVQLGVTRPTLREALQRLARDGWVEIHQGKPTRVRNFWQEGNLGLLNALACRPGRLNKDFVARLLEIRLLLSPAYTRLAVEKQPEQVIALLSQAAGLPASSQAFTEYDWRLHHLLTVASGNPIFTLILNGFRELYQIAGEVYFQETSRQAHSRHFYTTLLQASRKPNLQDVETITCQVMRESLDYWLNERS